MKHINTKPHMTHQELFQLLPWYVNKTLQDSELKAVEQHLSVCLVCKRELIQLQKLAQAVFHEGALESAEQASFSRLKKRLHGQPQFEQVNDSQTLSSSLQQGRSLKSAINVGHINPLKLQKHSKPSIPLPALAMAAALLLSLLVPRYAEIDLKNGSDFRTLSSDKQQVSVSVNEIRVVFAEMIKPQQKTEILDRIHGRITSEPTAQGVYTVQIDEDIAAKDVLDTVELLRKDTNVIFAEPAYALVSATRSEEK